MIYESRFSLNGCYRVAGIGEIANDVAKDNVEWVNAINDRGETPLHVAARYKKFDLLRAMLPHFEKIEARDNQGNTVMHALLHDNAIAVKNDKKCSELVETLIGKGCQVNKRNRNGWTPVHLAARNSQIEVLNVMERHEPDFSLRVENGDTTLHIACANMTSLVDSPAEMEIVNNLIIHGCDANAKNDKGYSVLHCAVDFCGARVVEKLIDCDADLDCQTNDLQLTPLHLAVRKKSTIVIDALAKAGANLNIPARAGLTPLHLSIVVGSLSVARCLIDNEANVNRVDQWTALHLAVYLKRKDLFKLLIREKADVNIPGVNGLTPLHFAALLGNFKYVKYLVDLGAEVNRRDNNGYTPLHLAVKDFHRRYLARLVESSMRAYAIDSRFSRYFASMSNNSPDRDHKIVARFLIDNGAEVNATTQDGESALHFAAETGNVKLVKYLLRRGAAVDCREKCDGYTPLHTATYWNRPNVVRELMNTDVDVSAYDKKTALRLAAFFKSEVNVTTKNGQCALHIATCYNHVDVVKELLNGNADVNVRTRDGKSPLHLAVEKSNTKVFKLLFKHGAGVSDEDKRLRNTPLHVAARENNDLMIQYLIKFGSKVNATNEDGFTPLHCAVDKSSVEAAGTLIECDADVNCKTSKCQLTPLHLALQRRCYDLVDMLIRAGAEVDVADNDGVTPLHLATLNNDALTMVTLICRGADVHCADKILRFTPLHIAVSEKNADTFDVLMEAGADVNASDGNGLTPLHLATILGSRHFAEALIDYGANVNCRDVSRYTPLHFAICNTRVLAKVSIKVYCNENSRISRSLNKTHEFARENYEDLVEFLVRSGGDLQAVTKRGESLLHFAAEANAASFIEILVDRGFEVDFVDKRSGMTPLQTAALNDHRETVVLLITSGADVEVVTECGKGLLHLATESGGTRVLECLLRRQSNCNDVAQRCPFMKTRSGRSELKSFSRTEFDVNAKDYFGMTPLHLAALHSNGKDALDILLVHGASTSKQDNQGFLPIHYAIKCNRHRQLESLLAFGVDVNDFEVYSKIDIDKIECDTNVGVRMLQHLMKLKALEFPVARVYEFVLRDLRYSECAFYRECLKEIEKLRCHFVGRDVSLYNLLHIEKQRGRCISLGNIEPRTIEREFPIYYGLLMDFYHKTVVRQSLMRRAEFALFRLTDVDFPVVCTGRIFHYLGIVSLLRLIKAAEIDRDESCRRSLCVPMENSKGTCRLDLLYVLFYQVFDACEFVRNIILALVCPVVSLLYWIINRLT